MSPSGTATTIRAVIVDDEELARQVLREYLAFHPGIDVVAECGDGFEAVKAVTELKPDILFLDIQMPKLNGFEVLELVGQDQPVVFVTAYDKYALQAFEVHAVDYLLKPFSRQRFDEALARARERLANRKPLPIAELALSARATAQPLERVILRDGSNVHVIPIDQIEYIEAQDDYISIRAAGRSYLKQQRLSVIEKSLDNSLFVRVHRSYILNVECLVRIESYSKDSRIAILKDGSKIQVSRAGYEKLRGVLR